MLEVFISFVAMCVRIKCSVPLDRQVAGLTQRKCCLHRSRGELLK